MGDGFADPTGTITLESANGANQVLFEFSLNGSDWSTFVANDTTYAFDTNVAQSATRSIYLRLTTLTSISVYDEYAATVTLVGSAP